MEAIVTKVLKKYFKLFIKNFKSDNFSMSLLKGEGTLVDLDLNEAIIQELLLIPPQFQVTHASCDSLSAKIPWTSFKNTPIVISLQTININLKEPEVIEPFLSQLKKFKSKNKGKRNEITENLQIEVKNLNLNIASLHGDTLKIEIKDIVIQSTNQNFQPGDLASIKTIDKELGVESLHKLITASSISIKIQDFGGMTKTILDNLPLKVLYSSKRRIKDWIQVSAKIEVLLKSLNLKWTLSEYHTLNDLINGFQATLARAIPASSPSQPSESYRKKLKSSLSFSSSKKKNKEKSELASTNSNNLTPLNVTPMSQSNNQAFTNESTSPMVVNKHLQQVLDSPQSSSSVTSSSSSVTSSTGNNSGGTGSSPINMSTDTINNDLPPPPKHSDFSYEFHIERFQLEILDNFAQEDSGFRFKSEGLHCAFTSANTLSKPINPETSQPYYTLPIRETILSVLFNSLTVHEMASFKSNQIKTELCNTNTVAGSGKQYNKAITSISSDTIVERVNINSYSGPCLLKGNLMFRRPITTAENPDPLKNLVGPPLVGLELNLNLNDLKIYGDRKCWKTLISYLMPPESDIESDLESEASGTDFNVQQRVLDLDGISDTTTTTTQSPTKNIVTSIVHVDTEDSNSTDESTTAPTTGSQTDPSKSHHHKSIVEKSKKKINTFKKKLKLSSNWKNQIKILLKASNTQVTLPEEKNDDQIFKGLRLIVSLGSFVMCNHSDWKSVPFLLDGLQLIDKFAQLDPVSHFGLDHRFSFQMENITLSAIDVEHDNKKTIILDPATISLFLRISRSQTLLNKHQKRIPKIDLALISSDFKFNLTTQHSELLDFIANKYLSPKKLKSLLKARISKEAKKRLKSLEEKKLDKTLTIKNKVEKTLQEYYWNAFISIQNGDFHLPLQHFLEPKEDKEGEGEVGTNDDGTSESISLTDSPISNSSTSIGPPPVASIIGTIVKDLKTSIIPDDLMTTPNGNNVKLPEILSQIKVQNLGIALQNNNLGQTIVFKIGSFEAYGIDHPKLSTSTILRPLPIPDDEVIPATNQDNTNLLITYKRRQQINSESAGNAILVDKEIEEWVTDVWVKLQGTQVRVMKKRFPQGYQKPKVSRKKIKMPDIKNFITKVVGMVERKRGKIKNIHKNIKKVNMNIKWGVELGNCEILLGEKSKVLGSSGVLDDFTIDPNYQPKGIIKITDTNRKVNAQAYRDIEDELLKKNQNLTENIMVDQEKDEYIKSLLKQIETLKQENDIASKDYKVLEEKYIKTKMDLAELQ
ncbi:hypothetical protein DICPUDRAFT_32310 [Dictyostelium purpureum]|uniref:Uncharacterized protein n=1 Tax=Dictyostelium purpureum TaxID=5786 RepID=F0ZIT9_DICPU|nr:uncharacterized protein DICPUDRAFT_32310 [Dictyostelium purpureum]EGC36147.1 hypothetical protein DICPUDRAFT_32310 [Dictyostelium purpureum]|eukprot:XP_003287340.1 hypothetical protein DICPUDRAFT_32310 [Dictyostelium purpureum]